MKYVIGIDGGATKYLIKACRTDGQELASYSGSPASHYYLSQAEVVARINHHIDCCLTQFHGRREDCAFLVCGTTGIDTVGDLAIVRAFYASLTGFLCPMTLLSDAETALYTATGGVGAIVIAGTGSIAFGRNARGDTARCGGWPPCIMGDEGSGAWIGYRAVNHMSLLLDERVPPSPLSKSLAGVLKIKSKEDLMAICLNIQQRTWQDPGLSLLVNEAAQGGDDQAIAILREAAIHTFSLADAIINKLHLFDDPEFQVAAWGSAITKCPHHYTRFKSLIQEKYPHAHVLISKTDAATGACRLAISQLLKQTM